MAGLIIVAIIVLILVTPILSYNTLQQLSHSVRRGNANITATLQKYTETINALQNVVVGFADHEKVINLRVSDNLAEMTTQTEQALNRITSLAQNYPEIKSDKTYMNLMDQISSIQSELQQARFDYNEAVDAYNSKRSTIPHVFIAGMFHFPEAPYYNPEKVAEINEFRTDDGEYLRQTLYKVSQSAIETTARAGNRIAGIAQRKDQGAIGMNEYYTGDETAQAQGMQQDNGHAGAFCPQCGQALPPGAAFCVHCGAQL